MILCSLFRLSCGTTWHSAGLLATSRGSRAHTKICQISQELYTNLEEETGLSTGGPLHMRVRTHTHTCKQLPSNQSIDKRISSHPKGGGVSRWGEWVRKATAYKFDTCTLIGVHSTMHLVDPIKVHVSYTCIHAHIHTHAHTCTNTCAHVYDTHTHTHTHTCTNTNTYTCTYTHRMQVDWKPVSSKD